MRFVLASQEAQQTLTRLYGSEPEGEKRYNPAKCLGTIWKKVTRTVSAPVRRRG